MPADHDKRLQSYLTAMGDLQNSVVMLDALHAFYSGNPPESASQHYRQQQNQLLGEFIARREELFDFWRPAPDRAFPGDKRRRYCRGRLYSTISANFRPQRQRTIFNRTGSTHGNDG